MFWHEASFGDDLGALTSLIAQKVGFNPVNLRLNLFLEHFNLASLRACKIISGKPPYLVYKLQHNYTNYEYPSLQGICDAAGAYLKR